MSERETAEEIEHRAAAWVARLDSAEPDAGQRAELDRWLAGDDRRRGAFLRAQAAWLMLDRARLLAGGDRGLEATAPPVADAAPLSRRRLIASSGALAAATLVGLTTRKLWQPAPQHIETSLGEIRRVPLRDGSLAAINTATRLAIDLQTDVREISVDRGEAWFQVAKDRRRPFVVAAGDVRVRAVGTAFSVRRLDEGADVQVTEGVVEVWTVDHEQGRKYVAAGARTFVSFGADPAVPHEASVEIDRSLSWRNGQLIFDGDTLFEAAAEFNRYNDRKLVVDPALAAERVVGRFRTNEPEAFATAAAGMFAARTATDAREIRLFPH